MDSVLPKPRLMGHIGVESLFQSENGFGKHVAFRISAEYQDDMMSRTSAPDPFFYLVATHIPDPAGGNR